MKSIRLVRTGHRAGNQQRDLLIASVAALLLGGLVIGGIYVLGGADAVSREDTATQASKLVEESIPKPTSPQSSLESDQRVSATRRLPGDGILQDQPPITTSHDEEVAPGAAAENREPEVIARNDEEHNPSNARSLLRTVRRQVKSGRTKAALATTQQIASLVESDSDRAKIEAKIGEAAGAADAGQLVDFDSLIELIEQVIEPNSWSSVGGAGTIQSFPGGVYVDTSGLMKPRPQQDGAADLSRQRDETRPAGSPPSASGDKTIRKISLPRLEREIAARLRAGQALTDEMRYLAGLQEIRYVFVYPEERDIVIAGPAEEWQLDEFQRVVGKQSGRPVLQLDDFAVILRACFSDSQNRGLFGCGIYPRAQRLQQVQEFLARSAAAGPIDPSQRNRWLGELRDQLGEQDIEVFGIHPASRAAHVLVEADYRMKLIGIGLEPAAVPGIPSYFELLGQPDDARLNRPIDTLRWWFTLNYDAITTSDARDAFELRGARVKVLSENELLTATGQRVHTGQSDPVNAEFARRFSDQFAALAERDVNFADLAGIFDLAVACGLLRGYELPKSVDWAMATLLDPDELIVALNPPPRTVETVINHQVYRGRNIVAAISGGVHVNPWTVVSNDRMVVESGGELKQHRSEANPVNTGTPTWWWD